MLKRIRVKLRNLFIAGLLAIVPFSITIFLFVFLLNKFDKIVYPAIKKLITSVGIAIPPGYHVPGLGFFVVILLILFAGLLTKGFIGKKLLHLWEKSVAQIPFARNIYTGAKQIVEAMTINHTVFREVVVIEYPRKGLLSIGFVTCASHSEIQRVANNENMVNVFIPTTPNPTSGVLVFIPKEEVNHLDITVEEGIKLVISGGIVSPSH